MNNNFNGNINIIGKYTGKSNGIIIGGVMYKKNITTNCIVNRDTFKRILSGIEEGWFELYEPTIGNIESVVKKELDKITYDDTEVRNQISSLQSEMGNTGKEITQIKAGIEQVSSQIDEFENEVDTIVANVTNGNESATNSELVAARLGYTALSGLNRYLKENVDNMNSDLEKVKNATYIETTEYSDTLTTTEVTDFLNPGGLTIEEGILSKPTAPSSRLYPLQLQTNKIEFNIQKSDIIMLSGDRKSEYVCLWVKHDTKPEMVGKLAVCTSSNTSTKYTFDIEPCQEGDLISVTIDEEKVVLTKNNESWLTINKNETPLINWDKDIYNLGILCTSEKNIDLCSNLKHNKLIEKNTPVNEVLINTKETVLELQKTKIISKWKGKKVAVIADSIGAGYGNTGYDSTTKTGGYSWIDSLSKTLEFGEVARHCKGGAMVSQWFIDEVDNIDEDTDLIIVMGGFNDYGQNVPIGTISDIDNTTFYGALNIFYQKLINKFPTKTILIITPLHANNNTWNGKSDGTQNTAGHILADYRTAEINRCEKYSLPYIDGFSLKLNPNIQALKDLYFNDGVHPNEIGDDELGGNILAPKINVI